MELEMLKPTTTHPVVEADRALRKARYDKSAVVALVVSVFLALWGAWMTNWGYQPFNSEIWSGIRVIWVVHFMATWGILQRGIYTVWAENGN
jgi:hypothetical protein